MGFIRILAVCVFMVMSVMPVAYACDEAENAMNDLEAALLPQAGLFETPTPQSAEQAIEPNTSVRQAPSSAYNQDILPPRRGGYSAQTGDTTAIARERANM